MAKPRSQFLDLAAYGVLRAVSCAMLILPLDWAIGLARTLAGLAFRIDRRHRAIAMENLRLALPGRFNDEQLARLVRKVYDHFAIMLLEMLYFTRKIRPGNWHRRVSIDQPDLWRSAATSGRPIMLISAHFGSWELSAYWPALFGIKGAIVGRSLDNPYVGRAVNRIREATGGRVLTKNGDAAQIREVLAQGGAVSTAGDQDAGPRGLFTTFFGRPASTHKALAVFALRTRALMLVGGMQRTGGFLEYTLRTTDFIDPADFAGQPDAVATYTQRMSTSLERLVRHDLSQYLWLHRRWKHQPENVAKAA